VLQVQGPLKRNLGGLCFLGYTFFMRTIVYVDGFNLYFRLLKQRPHLRWLNIKLLADNILSRANNVVAVKYYTARVSSRLKAESPAHQQIYLDALATVPEVSVHMGMFLTSEKFAPLVYPPTFRPENALAEPWPDVVRILKTEEKGSDVNLASHLLFDAFRDAYDVAAIISNDSDLVEPVRLVTQELGKPIGLLSPVKCPNPELELVASFVKRIRPSHLQAAQFPNPLTLHDGRLLSKPVHWCEQET
jgi:uncharacterized LabA/DUF88 family protein